MSAKQLLVLLLAALMLMAAGFTIFVGLSSRKHAKPTGSKLSWLGQTRGPGGDVLADVFLAARSETSALNPGKDITVAQILQSPCVWLWPVDGNGNSVQLKSGETSSEFELIVPYYGTPESGVSFSLRASPAGEFEASSVADALLAPFASYINYLGLVPKDPQEVCLAVDVRVVPGKISQLNSSYGPINFYRHDFGRAVDVEFSFRGSTRGFRVEPSSEDSDILGDKLGEAWISEYTGVMPLHSESSPPTDLWFSIDSGGLPEGKGPEAPAQE